MQVEIERETRTLEKADFHSLLACSLHPLYIKQGRTALSRNPSPFPVVNNHIYRIFS